MEIPFYKMQGAANDFIVINNKKLGFSQEKLVQLTKQICRPHFSLGSDALMVLDQARAGGDLRMRFFNADGTEAEMCGNGVRCLARFAYEEKLAGRDMVIETLAGKVRCWRLSKRQYKVQMNRPTVTKWDQPYKAGKIAVDYIELGDPGVPHLVVSYQGLAKTPLKDLRELASSLRSWDLLPKGANVNFCEVTASDEVILRTFERGVEDFTLACGTGAVSTAYTLLHKGKINSETVRLHTLGGLLQVLYKEGQLYLIGDTTIIAKGILVDEDCNFNE